MACGPDPEKNKSKIDVFLQNRVFFNFRVYIYMKCEPMVCRCNLSENPCCFFKVLGIEAYIMPIPCAQLILECFGVGICRVCGRYDFT